MSFSEGDYVQYRTAMGEVIGYGLVVGFSGSWIILLDQHTGEKEYWTSQHMLKVA
tara:strand:+ start:1910 stop:2074 length:165 start_codon:yes stop_codon:yes gene_type:complete